MFSACAAGCSSRGSVAAARGDAAALAAPSRGVGRAPELLAFTSGESREMPNMPDGRRVRVRARSRPLSEPRNLRGKVCSRPSRVPPGNLLYGYAPGSQESVGPNSLAPDALAPTTLHTDPGGVWEGRRDQQH